MLQHFVDCVAVLQQSFYDYPGYEGNESQSRRHDSIWRIQRSSRNGRFEAQAGQRRDGGPDRSCRKAAEVCWLVQVCWRIELEAEEETCKGSKEGREPIHQGALRLQGEASVSDCPSIAHEETQGDDQLIRLRRTLKAT